MASTEPASSAQCRVFDTYELFEHILYQLPPREVLTKAQRICKEWKYFIDNSSKLQQTLFLISLRSPLKCISTDPRETEMGCFYKDNIILNPLLFFERSHRSPTATHTDDEVETWSPGEPSIVHFHLCQSEDHSNEKWSMGLTFVVKQPLDAIKRPEASWRKMLLTQPPVTAVAHGSGYNDRKWNKFEKGKNLETGEPWSEDVSIMYNKTGVTLADFFDIQMKYEEDFHSKFHTGNDAEAKYKAEAEARAQAEWPRLPGYVSWFTCDPPAGNLETREAIEECQGESDEYMQKRKAFECDCIEALHRGL